MVTLIAQANDFVHQVPLGYLLALSLFMFCTGAAGVAIRRNPVVVFMCIELMLNAVNLSFLAFARYAPFTSGDISTMESALTGQMMVIFVMAVAASEVAVGLGIIMAVLRNRDEVDIDEMSTMRN